MTNFFSKFRIPTILGLGIIILGLIGGVYLVLREQIFFSQAAPSVTPQNIIISNISENSATISYSTTSATSSFITYGTQNPQDQTVLDDRDNTKPTPRTIHYVTLKNLSPQTAYRFKIHSNKILSETLKFETSKPPANKTELTPVIGSVMLNDNTPLNNGIAYLSITGTVIQSTLIKGGNFLIPLSKIQVENLPQTAKLTITAESGEASAIIKLPASSQLLPAIILGQNVDLTILPPTPQPIPTVNDLEQYDQNNDKIINANDYAIVSSCRNKKPVKPCAKADINKDGKIDQKDLDLISQKIKELGLQ